MYELSPKCYTLTPSEGHRFIDVLKCMKVPFGYGSNICWCITFMDHEFYGLKSHGRANVIVVTYIVGGLVLENVMLLVVDNSWVFKDLCS